MDGKNTIQLVNNWFNSSIPIITLNVNGLNTPVKKGRDGQVGF